MQHPDARLSVYQRRLIVDRVANGWSVTRAARAAGVSRQTASKWVNRFRRNGPDALRDASSRPLHTRPRVGRDVVKRVVKARLRFRCGPHYLGWQLALPGSTVHVVLRRLGLNRLQRPEREKVVRYEWPEPEDLVHRDIKRLRRIGEGGGHRVPGWAAKHRHPGPMNPHRQRIGLLLLRLPGSAGRARHLDTEDPPVPSSDQRHGGGVRRDREQRVGVREGVSETHRSGPIGPVRS
ncbi:helix-turn-helix domain-containing protein [Azovibrio sp.]|uniref:helix-turn-helix domain-containing protein n=1 Tax=Azovibrio sp. TaxID=1872673 RepID=UPI003C708ED2